MATESDPTTTAIGKAIEEGVKVTKDWGDKLLGPTLTQGGGILGDTVAYWRFKNQIRLLEKTKQYLDAKGISPKALPPTLVVPLLEHGSRMQERWSRLLAGAVAEPDYVSPAFPKILSEQSPLEANIVDVDAKASGIRRLDGWQHGMRYAMSSRTNLDPLTPSTSGGRWAPKNEPAVLYMSTEHEGALAEIALHWSQFYPLPSKPAALHLVGLSARRTMRLLRADLVDLGVDWARYGEMSYERSQAIGAAVALLECDGLLAPSARCSCETVVLFVDNHAPDNRLEVLATEEAVDWLTWARANDLLAPENRDQSAEG